MGHIFTRLIEKWKMGPLLLTRRDVDVGAMTSWELLDWLRNHGWPCKSVITRTQRGQARTAPFIASAPVPQKTWYIGKESVSHFYLQALVTADMAGWAAPVPHLDKVGTYMALLGLQNPKKQRRSHKRRLRFGFKFAASLDDLWVEPALRRPRRKRRRLAASPARSSSSRSSSGMSGTTGSSRSGSRSPGPADMSPFAPPSRSPSPARSVPGDAGGAGPSSGRRSPSPARSVPRDAGASSSSGRRSPSPAASARSARSACTAASHGRNANAAQVWGTWFRLTPTANGFQMTCLNSKHVGCSKTRSSRIAGREAALNCLKAWALRGLAAEDTGEHRSFWPDIVGEYQAGSLPTIEDHETQENKTIEDKAHTQENKTIEDPQNKTHKKTQSRTLTQQWALCLHGRWLVHHTLRRLRSLRLLLRLALQALRQTRPAPEAPALHQGPIDFVESVAGFELEVDDGNRNASHCKGGSRPSKGSKGS